jgi:glyoxylase-like metal-dependent hydrolase (beta-lactamase superfamily II)
VGLAEGDSIELEEVLFQVLETPGHTPHHLSYVVIDKSRSDSPLGVFTGDTLLWGM